MVQPTRILKLLLSMETYSSRSVTLRWCCSNHIMDGVSGSWIDSVVAQYRLEGILLVFLDSLRTYDLLSGQRDNGIPSNFIYLINIPLENVECSNKTILCFDGTKSPPTMIFTSIKQKHLCPSHICVINIWIMIVISSETRKRGIWSQTDDILMIES